MEKKEQIEIRTNEIESILGKSPTWLVRWGTTIMAGVLGILLAISYFFSYPDMVSVPLTILPERMPVQIVIPEDINLKNIFVEGNEEVKKGASLLEGVTDSGKVCVLKSPEAGRVVFSSVLLPGERLKVGEKSMLVVLSGSGNYYGVVKIPAADMAKVKPGQSAQIRLDLYPYMQYGVLNAKVTQVAQVPTAGFYPVMITLPEENISNYGRKLVLQPEMTGTVNIITKNMSLFERFIAPVRAVVK